MANGTCWIDSTRFCAVTTMSGELPTVSSKGAVVCADAPPADSKKANILDLSLVAAKLIKRVAAEPRRREQLVDQKDHIERGAASAPTILRLA